MFVSEQCAVRVRQRNAVFQPWHKPTIVLPLVYRPVDNTLFEVGPEIRCLGPSSCYCCYGNRAASSKPINFYHAMPCAARTVPSQDVCLSVLLSVCLSHAGILSRHSTFHQTVFTVGYAHHSSFCSIKRYGYIPTDPLTPPNGDVECRSVWKKAIFDQYLAMSHNCCNIRQ